MLGPTATFRDGQREAIEAVAQDGRRALVVQRTGWGKCLVYWIATRVRRDTGHGPTLIISPLLALMRNQIAMAADGCRPWYSMVTVAGREPDAHPEGGLSRTRWPETLSQSMTSSPWRPSENARWLCRSIRLAFCAVACRRGRMLS